jgi:predicted ATPase
MGVEQHGDDRKWCEWLTANLRFRHPKVARIAADVSPQQFATALEAGATALANLRADGAAMLDETQLQLAQTKLRTYLVTFELQTMRRDDRVHIDVSDPGAVERRPFDHLSAGQQRSVLLSLMLSADRDEPLVIDQPEDHLDAQYIARSVVRQLEAAKEKRQVIIATHSANLVVLGDAELVIPMVAWQGRGHSDEPGAVDRPQTRELVCQLLEGGRGAYKRRGERYGFEVRPAVR